MLVTERANLSPSTSENLVRSLRRQSDPPSASACPGDSAAHAVLVPYFALIDDHGRALLPGMPADECGKPQQTALKALSVLRFQRLSSAPMQ